jgi:hypothetical protein
MKKHFYRKAYEALFFQTSNETVISMEVINNLHADILFKQCSFRSFAASYNYLHSQASYDRSSMQYKRLIELFYSHNLCKYFDTILDSVLISKLMLLTF